MRRRQASTARANMAAIERSKETQRSRATDVVSTMFENDVCRATGRTLAGAAPLVFQAMCRREGIRVAFTHAPMTDGRVIWLGGIDLTDPLASVYVYGHGCHERHHVVYTDFKEISNIEDKAIHGLTNIFEDIRIDRLGAKDYAGYLLWRRALFQALKGSGLAAWTHPDELNDADLLTFWLLITLEVRILGIESLESERLRLDRRARDCFGEKFVLDVLSAVLCEFPLQNTTAAVLLAKRVWSMVKRYARKAKKELDAYVPEVANKLEFSESRQGSLFDNDGDVILLADPNVNQPGFANLHKVARCLNNLASSDNFEGVKKDQDNFRALLQNSQFTNTDESVGDMNPRFASQEDYRCLDERVAEAQRQDFRRLWAQSGSLKRLFQNALTHPLPLPVRLSHMGSDLDADAIALMSAGEDRVFHQSGSVMGREMAIEFLLDTSGSMDRLPMTNAKVVALRSLEACRATSGMKAAMSLFPGAGYRGVTTAATFETPIREVAERIEFIDGFGSTPILQALFCSGLKLNQRSEPAKAIIVITDGRFELKQTEAMIRDLKICGIVVGMIGIGRDSTPCGDYTAIVDTTDDLPKAMSSLLGKMSKALRFGTRNR